jgi:hypothetical protein
MDNESLGKSETSLLVLKTSPLEEHSFNMLGPGDHRHLVDR